MQRKLVGLIIVLGLFAIEHRADAQQARFGLRGGVTDDPDSIFFGGHMAFHPGSLPNLRIEPSLEMGLGDEGPFDYLTLRLNVNFKYAIPVGNDMAFFPLLGPAIYYINVDDCPGDCDDTNFGINIGFGFAFSGFALELAVGVDDIPDITLTFSYTF